MSRTGGRKFRGGKGRTFFPSGPPRNMGTSHILGLPQGVKLVLITGRDQGGVREREGGGLG